MARTRAKRVWRNSRNSLSPVDRTGLKPWSEKKGGYCSICHQSEKAPCCIFQRHKKQPLRKEGPGHGPGKRPNQEPPRPGILNPGTYCPSLKLSNSCATNAGGRVKPCHIDNLGKNRHQESTCRPQTKRDMLVRTPPLKGRRFFHLEPRALKWQGWKYQTRGEWEHAPRHRHDHMLL